MIKVCCHTNLDLRGESWPKKLPAVPQVGHQIQSETVWSSGFQLRLEVISVTWVSMFGDWSPEIELHIPTRRKWSIRQFYEWYAPLVGKSAGAFI